MPELPEVEFCRRTLARWGAGRRLVAVDVLDPRCIRASTSARPSAGLVDGAARLAAFVGRTAEEPVRHGKRLLWAFGDAALLLHLGMTGKWTRRDVATPKVTLTFEGTGAIHFRDPRLLGGIVPTDVVRGPALLVDGLGPDALRDPFPRLRGARAVKVALLDQGVVAGLGNLHAAEALWRARLDPRLPCDALDDADHAALAAGVAEQLRFALALDADGDEITYVEDVGGPNPFPLYQRGGEPCPRCGAPIERLVQAGRSTWWCPACQARPGLSSRS